MKKLGDGRGTIKVEPGPEGIVIRVHDAKEAMQLVKKPLNGTIALIRGGTCTFASILMVKGIPGIITLEGAPQSHLGVVSKEFEIPCIMQFTPTDPDILSKKDTNYEEYLEDITKMLEGKKVKFDLTGEESEGYIKASVIEV